MPSAANPPSLEPLTRRAIFAQAWPIMLGQASVPLVGIVDAAVIGRTGDATALAGVALGATVISLVFWSFGFLRMGLTGPTAQAHGASDNDEVAALLLRGLIVGAVVGIGLLLLAGPLATLAFTLLAGDAGVTAEARGYVVARFFGAPAALATFALTGWLLGLGRTRAALVLQLTTNTANVALDLLFVWGMGLGAAGVGWGTAGAEWVAAAAGLVIASRVAGASPLALFKRLAHQRLLDRPALLRLFAINRDIMLRTFALLLMMSWFANAGARLGTVTLAANHVLMQFVSLAAFVLDAFAFTAEARIGQAIGARSPDRFARSVRLTGEFSLTAALLLGLLFLSAGSLLIHAITTDPAVRMTAHSFLPFAALVPLLGMPAWLLDGIFIGATAGRPLRNGAVTATALYLALDLALRPWGNQGVWLAFLSAYLLRAVALGLYYPTLRRSLG